jgi:hypothetical protein
MSEFKRITKSQAKVIRHLLNSASTDTARPLLMAIQVNVEDDYICSADGFMLTFVKYKDSELESIFPVNGIFQIAMGKMQQDYIIEVTQLANSNYPTLQSEVTQSISRLGGLVISFQKGAFQGEVIRDGFRIHYAITATDGHQVPGRIDIAALPAYSDKRRDASLRMALYMLRVALDGTWFLQQLSPGYSALVPFMLVKDDKTLSQMWSESSIMNNLLPPGEDEFTEGEYKEIK